MMFPVMWKLIKAFTEFFLLNSKLELFNSLKKKKQKVLLSGEQQQKLV